MNSTAFEGKAALVTGGTTGIGRAITLALASEGAQVFIFGRHEDTLRDALKDANDLAPGKVQGMLADAGKHDDLIRVFQEIDSRFGHLDFLINNAGLSGESVTDTDYAAWRYVVETNLIGYMDCCQLAYQRMLEDGGHIVNIGSVSAQELGEGGDVYVATKSGVQGFSTSLQRLLGDKDIRVTLVEPGWVGSDMTLKEGGADEQRSKQSEGTMLCAEDIASGVIYALKQPSRTTVTTLRIEARIYQ